MKLTLETARKMYASNDESIKAFALENFSKEQLEPKKEWWKELEMEVYAVFSNYKGFYGDTIFGTRNPQHTLTQQQAQILAKKFTLMQEMTRFRDLRNGDWVADFSDINQNKWGIIFNESKNETDYNCVFSNMFTFGIAVKSEEIAEEMQSIFGDRIKEVYNL